MLELDMRTPSRRLVLGSYFYLLIPAAMQLGFWLAWYLVLLVVGSTLALSHHLITQVPTSDRRIHWLVPAVSGAAVAFLAGAGGVLAYTGDWRKHYALLRDLTEHAWPVLYQLAEGDGVLSYSAAWYMPAAAVGKVLGWSAANIAIAVWMAFGIALIIAWVISLVGHREAALVVLLFSGLDLVGRLVLPLISDWNIAPRSTLEVWSGEWQNPSIIRSFFEAPQHTIPTLVAAGLILSGELRERPPLVQAAVVGAVAISSPFAAVAILPFIAFTFRWTKWSERSTASAELGSVAFMICVVSFYAIRLGGPPVGIPDEVEFGLTLLNPIFDAGLGNHLIALVAVLILELLVYALPLRSLVGESGQRLVALSVVVFALALMIRVGRNNDFAMRVPTMAIFVIALLAALVFVNRSIKGRWMIAVVLIIGVLTPAFEIRRNLTGESYDHYSFSSIEATASLTDLQQHWYSKRDSLLSQYLSDTDGPARLVLRGGDS